MTVRTVAFYTRNDGPFQTGKQRRGEPGVDDDPVNQGRRRADEC
jgi:hypothetical protein